MGKVHDKRKAEIEAEEAKKWICAHCDTFVEAEGDLCRACAQYQRDVRDGLYDDQDYGEAWEQALNNF